MWCVMIACCVRIQGSQGINGLACRVREVEKPPKKKQDAVAQLKALCSEAHLACMTCPSGISRATGEARLQTIFCSGQNFNESADFTSVLKYLLRAVVRSKPGLCFCAL